MLILFSNIKKNGNILKVIKEILLFLFGVLVFLITFANIIHNGFFDYIQKILENIQHNDNKSYGVIALCINYFRDGKIIIYYMLSLGIYSILRTTNYKSSIIKKFQNIFINILFMFFMFLTIFNSPYNFNQSLFLSAFVLFIIIEHFLSCLSKPKFFEYQIIAIILLYSSISFWGSNTGLLKLSPLLIIFLPLLFYFKRAYFLKSIFVFISITLLIIVNASKPYEDQRISYLNKKLHIDKVNYIYTSKLRADFINDVLIEFNKLNDKKNLIFYGKVAHVFYFLTDTKDLIEYSFKMNINNTSDLKLISENIKVNRPVIIYTPDYPENLNDMNNGRLIQLAECSGYRVVKKNGFIIFMP